MDKLNRKYKLSIQTRDGGLKTIALPFTVEFDIHRNSFSSANTCSIRIYNLAPVTRDLIRKDPTDYGDQREITFQAGYGDKLSLGFKGNIQQAWSSREGSNMITEIECFDAGFAYVNATYEGPPFPKGTPDRTILATMAQSIGGGVSVGAIGPSYDGVTTRGTAITGSPIERLTELSEGGFFIDGQVANVLAENEALYTGGIPLINAASGLLGTPLLESTFVHVEMLFEPGIQVAQLVQLESQTATRFNGQHKVVGIKHRGTISEAVSGNAVTTLILLPGTFTPVKAGT